MMFSANIYVAGAHAASVVVAARLLVGPEGSDGKNIGLPYVLLVNISHVSQVGGIAAVLRLSQLPP